MSIFDRLQKRFPERRTPLNCREDGHAFCMAINDTIICARCGSTKAEAEARAKAGEYEYEAIRYLDREKEI